MTDFNRSARAALSDMPADAWAIWRTRYTAESGMELQVRSVVEQAEAAMRSAGEETTIRTVWVRLADRATAEGTPELRAAAALAGMAMGLRPS